MFHYYNAQNNQQIVSNTNHDVHDAASTLKAIACKVKLTLAINQQVNRYDPKIDDQPK